MKKSLFVCLVLSAAPAAAQTLDEDAAKAELFRTDRETVQLSSALTDADKSAIKSLIPLLEQQVGRPIDYYSSIAYAPDQGFISEALQGAFNYHSVTAADRAALSECENAKPTGAGPCRIAARVIPRAYGERTLTLSAAATRAFESVYVGRGAPKVFAISPSSGAWGIGEDDNIAISGCAERGASDCQPVIRD